MSSHFDQKRLKHPGSSSFPAVASPPYPGHAESSIMVDEHFDGSLTEKQAHRSVWRNSAGGRPFRATILDLPGDCLLQIFDLYIYEESEMWHTLAHVCYRWRSIVFGSPSRLDLRLYCTARTPVRKMLGVWPAFPIVLRVYSDTMWGERNIVAALEHNHRIWELDLFDIPSSQLEKVLSAMQLSFPALTHLRLGCEDDTAPVVPASFLGGFASNLQTLFLDYISFPGLPKLLLSAAHLVDLDLWRIPLAGYISPEAMVACLSVLTKLERLDIGFESPQSRPNQISRLPPPQTLTLLPALAKLRFIGVDEYLEDLVAQIDTPLLHNLAITFFNQVIFETSQLSQFISRTPKLMTHEEARVVFSARDVSITFPRTFDGRLELVISCRESDWQLFSLVEVCSSSFPQTLAVEQLYILEDGFPRLHWGDDIENNRWLHLLRLFTGVKDLYVSQEFIPRIMPAVQELVGERVVDVLPALQSLFLEEPPLSGHVPKTIGQFVAARQLARFPIAVYLWERKEIED